MRDDNWHRGAEHHHRHEHDGHGPDPQREHGHRHHGFHHDEASRDHGGRYGGDHRSGESDSSHSPFDGGRADHGIPHGPDAESSGLQHSGGDPGGGDDLGWNDAAWADAGGFEAVLFGHLPEGVMAGAAGASFVIMPIEHLDVTFNTLIQNTFVDNTQILFDATNGGSVDVGGDVTALSLQHAVIDQTGALPDLSHLA